MPELTELSDHALCPDSNGGRRTCPETRVPILVGRLTLCIPTTETRSIPFDDRGLDACLKWPGNTPLVTFGGTWAGIFGVIQWPRMGGIIPRFKSI